MSRFDRLAIFIAHHARAVVLTWVVAAIAMASLALVGVGQGGLFERVHTGAAVINGSDSSLVRSELNRAESPDVGPWFGIQVSHVEVGEEATAAAVAKAAEAIAGTPGVTTVATPWGVVLGEAFDPALAGAGDPAALMASLRSDDGKAFLIYVSYADLGGSAEAAELHRAHAPTIAALRDALADPRISALEDVTITTFSVPILIEDFNDQIERDLIAGEIIALPAALIVMILVFGGFLAASTPIAGALASIAGGLAILFAFSYPIDLDSSAVNVVTVLGIGLSIDYGLLLVSRYREQLFATHDTPGHDTREEALRITMRTAGRTILFSGITVAIAVGGMLVFNAEILRAFGGAALGVVTMCVLTSLTLVPAIAHLFGHRLARPSVLSRVGWLRGLLSHTANVEREEGAFSRLASVVQRRPWLWIVGCVTLLLVLASPLLNLQLRNSGAELLPESNERRQYLEGIRDNFDAIRESGATVLIAGDEADSARFVDAASQSEGVARVVLAGPTGDYQRVEVWFTDRDSGGEPAAEATQALRDLDVGVETYVGGRAASQLDFTNALVTGAFWAGGLVVLSTFILLFLMTGSLLVPLKTLIINSLSLAATLGVISWVFGDGHLENVLAFKSVGGIETYVLALVVAFGFGLAMDYEVFLLSRIKELVDAGVPNDQAVRSGLQRSGRIITSAATIVILVFLGFALGQLLVIKEVGFGLAFAVLLDATIVRLLLVPATMTLLGEWNWWAPKPLTRLYERYQVKH